MINVLGMGTGIVIRDSVLRSGERSSVQDPLIRYSREVGWTYLPPDEAMRLRGGKIGVEPQSVTLGR